MKRIFLIMMMLQLLQIGCSKRYVLSYLPLDNTSSEIKQNNCVLKGIIYVKEPCMSEKYTTYSGNLVTIENTKLGAYTDSCGEFIIKDIPIGKYNITAKSMGYHSVTIRNIRLYSEKVTYIKFYLDNNIIIY